MSEQTLQPGWLPWPTREGWWWMMTPGEKARPTHASESERNGIVVSTGASNMMYMNGAFPGSQFFLVAPPPDGLTLARDGVGFNTIKHDAFSVESDGEQVFVDSGWMLPDDARALASAILLAAELIEQQGAK